MPFYLRVHMWSEFSGCAGQRRRSIRTGQLFSVINRRRVFNGLVLGTDSGTQENSNKHRYTLQSVTGTDSH